MFFLSSMNLYIIQVNLYVGLERGNIHLLITGMCQFLISCYVTRGFILEG